MGYKDREDFIDYYEVYLKIKHLLYGVHTHSYVEVGDRYEGLVHDLLTHLESIDIIEELYINTEYAPYGGVADMKASLYDELDALRLMSTEIEEREGDED